ncbi:MAG: hypothetical protein GX430_12475 [Treponema sp.]|nr:hypothetical protein [Treponema sp.]
MKRFLTVVLLCLAAAAAFPQSDSEIRTLIGKAELIGELQVNFKADFDVLPVRLKEGALRRLVFLAEGNDVEIERIVVTYGDGRKDEIPLRHRFAEGTRSRAVDLEGGRRIIRTIAFYYRTAGRLKDGRAVLKVYGIK